MDFKLDNDFKKIKDQAKKWILGKTLEKDGLLIHADIDGITSGLLLANQTNKQIIAIYDLLTIYSINDVLDFNKIMAVDLDLNIQGLNCIGHHMIPHINRYSFNINYYSGVSKGEGVYKNYAQKYPLNTIILLYAILGKQPKSDREIALLMYCDSVILNYIGYGNGRCYKQNVLDWLNYLGMTTIIDVLENRIDVIMDIINKEIAPICDKIGIGTYRQSRYSQCYLTSRKKKELTYKKEDLVELINLISDILDIKKEYMHYEYPYKTSYYETRKDFFNKNIKDIDVIRDKYAILINSIIRYKDDIVSMGLPFRHTISLTTVKPYKIENCELIPLNKD